MSNWKLIKPEGRVNYIKNPSFRYNYDDGWSFTDEGTGAYLTRNPSYAWVGAYGLQIYSGDTGAYIETDYTFSVADGDTVHFHAMVVPDNITYLYLLDSSNNTLDIDSNNGDVDWVEMYASWTNDTGSAVDVKCRIRVEGSDKFTLVDAIVAEVYEDLSSDAANEKTTYLDGDQDGCWWRGEPHNSYSERSSASRAGGRLMDLTDDYDFEVRTIIDAGAPPITHYMHEYAIKPGGEVRGTKVHPRGWTMSGRLRDQDHGGDNIHAMRNKLIDEIMPWVYPKHRRQYQPVRLRYQGSAVEKEAAVHYEGPGLGGNLDVGPVMLNIEELDLNWMQPYPYWESLYVSAESMTPRDTLTTRLVHMRDGETGAWDALGVSAPTTYGSVYAMAYNHVDAKIYVAGQFEGFNGNSGWDHVVRYDPVSESWEQVGGASAVTGTVNSIAINHNGDVYIGGSFTNVGDADGDYLAYFDLSAGSWASIASGGASLVNTIIFDQQGRLWFGGTFSSWNGDSNIAYIGYWDGSSYNAADTGADNNVEDLAVFGDRVYAVGDFTSPGNHFAYWQDGAWSDGDTASQTSALACIGIARSGIVYLGEDSSDAKVWQYSGGQLIEIGQSYYSNSPGNENINAIDVAPDGVVYVTGSFSQMEDNEYCWWMAKWNGSSWLSPPYTQLTAYVVANALVFINQDPIVESNYDIYIGQSLPDELIIEIPNQVTVTNSGDAPAHPLITLEQGAADGVVLLIRNLSTGKAIHSNYNLLAGETLKIDTKNGASAHSDLSGIVSDAILPGSDESDFYLLRGDNVLEFFVSGSGTSPTVQVSWHDTYSGID